MSDRAVELFSELSQINVQYKAEVPGRRRAWPQSLKDRIFELRSLGLSFKEIAQRSGISYQTIVSWKKPNSFLPVAIVENKNSTVTVVKSKRQRIPKNMPIIITTPSGTKIEGLDFKCMMTLIEQLGLK